MWTYHEPTKLIFGMGAAENLNSEMEALGVTKAVLLSSKSMFRQGVPQQLAEHALKNNNYANNVAQIGYDGLYKLFEEKF